MPVTKPLLAACVLVALGYAAYPYVTLYRLQAAIHSGDAQALKTLVNWPAVREGIKHDICDRQAATPDRGELPGFGASFVSGIATQAVDRRVTPEGLVKAAHATGPGPAEGSGVQVQWAFFDGPTQFTVSLSTPGQPAPIRLQMRLRDTEWRVDRVWLPPNLLDQANART